MIQLGILELEPSRRQLRVRGELVSLGARGFDVLHTLVKAGGAMVSKETLLAQGWPRVVVEENNLQVQIAAIRRALGEDRELVETVMRVGYRLMVERIIDATGTRADPSDAMPIPGSTNLPFPVNDLVGRDQAVDAVIAQLAASRIVTLTGAGGIGKTRLALEVGHRVLRQFEHGVWLAELGALTEREFVAGRVGDALGIRAERFSSRLEEIARQVGDRSLLLVLDNCEHVVEEVALLAEHIVCAVPNARILATSREALYVEGESIFQVAPLDTVVPDHADATAVPTAVQLFLMRMRALTARVPVDSESLGAMSKLCMRLEGIPLAIEIAAAWAPTLGIAQIDARLDDRIGLEMGAHRTSRARHRTLGETLDWSFGLLGEAEQALLCSLAVFHGGFTLDAALAVFSDHPPVAEVIAMLSALVRKSLVLVDTDTGGTRYRLLETMRAYLAAKLHERGAWDRVKRRHARFFARLLGPMRESLSSERREASLRQCRRELDNVRAAIEWSLTERRDVEIGVELAECAAAVMWDLSLHEECAAVAGQALHECVRVRALDPRVELSLLALRAGSSAYTLGPTDEVAQAWRDMQGRARALGETGALIRSTWGLWTQKWYAGEAAACLEVANDFARIEGPYGETVSLLGARMIGIAAHFSGDQREAYRRLEHVVALYDVDVHTFPAVGTRFDQRRASRVTLARVHWLRGDVDEAIAESERLPDDCDWDAPPLLSTYALLEAALPIALTLRRWDAAQRFSDELQRRLTVHPVPVWQACADCFADLAALRVMRSPHRLESLRANLDRMRKMNFLAHLSMIQCQLAESLAAVGRTSEALSVVNEAIAFCERTGEHWCLAELMRVRAELWRKSSTDSSMAERELELAIHLAQAQGALFWELRVAKSLAGLWCAEGRPNDARALLRSVYDKFRPACEVADLTAARVMLSSLE